MKRLGVIAGKYNELDNMYFLCSGPSAIRMPAWEVWGTAREERLSGLDRELSLRGRVTEAEQIRMAQDMEEVRKDISESRAFGEEYVAPAPECRTLVAHTQRKESMQRLHDWLGIIIQNQELVDATNFVIVHDCILWHMLTDLERLLRSSTIR